MRIVDRKAFLALPAGTVYQKYAPCYFESINVKDETCGTNDWLYRCGVDQPDFPEADDSGAWFDCCAAMEGGETKALHFEAVSRDGLFDAEQLFAIWEPDDIRGLIRVLQNALGEDEWITPPREIME